MKIEPSPKVMLGMYMIQYAVEAPYQDIGALLKLAENLLLLERLSSN